MDNYLENRGSFQGKTSNNFTYGTNNSGGLVKISLIAIAIGIWMLVFQNFGIIPSKKNVGVENTVDVRGKVDVEGKVDVGNVVDMNIKEINGQENVFYNDPGHGHPDKYFKLPVGY